MLRWDLSVRSMSWTWWRRLQLWRAKCSRITKVCPPLSSCNQSAGSSRRDLSLLSGLADVKGYMSGSSSIVKKPLHVTAGVQKVIEEHGPRVRQDTITRPAGRGLA